MQRSRQPCCVIVNSHWLTSPVSPRVITTSFVLRCLIHVSNPTGGFPDDINTDYNTDVIKPSSSSLCYYQDILITYFT